MKNGKPSRQGYPLPALFLLVAVCAVIVAMVTPAIETIAGGQAEAEAVAACVAGAVIFSGLLGAIVGLHHFRRRRGLGYGILAGVFVGTMVGLLAVVPIERLSDVAMATVGGACVLLSIGAVAQLTAKPTVITLEPDDPNDIANVVLVQDGTVSRLSEHDVDD